MVFLFLRARLPSALCSLAQMSRTAYLHGVSGAANAQSEVLTSSLYALTTLLHWSLDNAHCQNINFNRRFWTASRFSPRSSGCWGGEPCARGSAFGIPGCVGGLATDSATAARRLREAKKRWDTKKEREQQAARGQQEIRPVETAAVTPLEAQPSDVQVRRGCRFGTATNQLRLEYGSILLRCTCVFSHLHSLFFRSGPNGSMPSVF